MFCPSNVRQYLPLCSIPVQMSRDGWAGPNAHIYLPFYQPDLYYFSGAQHTYPGSVIPQDGSRLNNGRNLPVVSGKGFNCDALTGCA